MALSKSINLKKRFVALSINLKKVSNIYISNLTDLAESVMHPEGTSVILVLFRGDPPLQR